MCTGQVYSIAQTESIHVRFLLMCTRAPTENTGVWAHKGIVGPYVHLSFQTGSQDSHSQITDSAS